MTQIKSSDWLAKVGGGVVALYFAAENRLERFRDGNCVDAEVAVEVDHEAYVEQNFTQRACERAVGPIF